MMIPTKEIHKAVFILLEVNQIISTIQFVDLVVILPYIRDVMNCTGDGMRHET